MKLSVSDKTAEANEVVHFPLTIEKSPDEELNAILGMLVEAPRDNPGDQIATYMGLMARCTELKVYCLEHEGKDRKLKILRTQKLAPIIELIDFLFRGASRLVEVARLDVELSK